MVTTSMPFESVFDPRHRMERIIFTILIHVSDLSLTRTRFTDLSQVSDELADAIPGSRHF